MGGINTYSLLAIGTDKSALITDSQERLYYKSGKGQPFQKKRFKQTVTIEINHEQKITPPNIINFSNLKIASEIIDELEKRTTLQKIIQ